MPELLISLALAGKGGSLTRVDSVYSFAGCERHVRIELIQS
jgi:hypothetical protein